jgi:hypothetical protein
MRVILEHVVAVDNVRLNPALVETASQIDQITRGE